jgi:pentafunctional AROM polypeptide
MRAAGKTTLGRVAALVLGYKFIDLDQYMDSIAGLGGVKGLIEGKGWEEFRCLEAETLAACLKANPHGTVISCGGGIVERRENRELLKTCPFPIIWINRDIDDIEAFLLKDTSRPQFPEPIRDVFGRRRPWYQECSSHEFVVLFGDNNLERIAQTFGRFVRNAAGESLDPLRDNSFFVCLAVPDVLRAGNLSAVCGGAHAIELRVDHLVDQRPEFVQQQIAHLRQAVDLPIIFTVRSKAQGGRFEGAEDEYFALLGVGVRAGCDFVDLESQWTEGSRLSFLSMRMGSRVIGSAHHQRPCRSASEFESICSQCWYGGAVDIVKVVFAAEGLEDCFLVHSARLSIARAGAIKAPVIALCMGDAGRLSRVLNTFMSPVTHELLPSVAAPGQMSAAEIIAARMLLHVLPQRIFYIFGSPVGLSPSPLLHNAGFTALEVPYHYDAVDTTDAARAAEILRLEATGGANITIPLKQSIIPYLDALSPAARAIGAVNTVIKEGAHGVLIGDNTDWVGIFRPLRAALGTRARGRALIIGAGGTALAAAYALRSLAFAEVVLWNRTPSKAADVAQRFGLSMCEDLAALAGVDAVVCTLPPAVGFTVPACVLASKPVVLDVAYLPRDTPLLVQARDAGCVVIPGIEMLLEQGIAAHRLWTMREPQAGVMRALVMREYAALSSAEPLARAIARVPKKEDVWHMLKAHTTEL